MQLHVGCGEHFLRHKIEKLLQVVKDWQACLAVRQRLAQNRKGAEGGVRLASASSVLAEEEGRLFGIFPKIYPFWWCHPSLKAR